MSTSARQPCEHWQNQGTSFKLSLEYLTGIQMLIGEESEFSWPQTKKPTIKQTETNLDIGRSYKGMYLKMKNFGHCAIKLGLQTVFILQPELGLELLSLSEAII